MKREGSQREERERESRKADGSRRSEKIKDKAWIMQFAEAAEG